MQATVSVSWVAQASVLGGGGGGGGGGGVVPRPSWNAAAAGRWQRFGFGVVRCCVQEKKPRVRKTKEERREMVESFVHTYRVSNDGKFPSVNLTHKEVGGSYYIVREIVRDIIQENKVLGPGGLNAKALSFEDPYSSVLPVRHGLCQDNIEILDIYHENQVGMDTVMDNEEVWSLQNNAMNTQQLLGSSSLLDTATLNSAVQNGHVEDMAHLETDHEKEDEVPCMKSTEIGPSTSEKLHASESEKELEIGSWMDAHETTSSITNGVIHSSEPSDVYTNGAFPQDDETLPDDYHDDTTNTAIDEAVLCLQNNGVLQTNQTPVQEHETLPEGVMSNDVQIINNGQLNSTMDAFNSSTSYPEKEDTAKLIEVSEIQRVQDEFEQSIVVASPDEKENSEILISHPELDTKVLHIEGKHSVEERNSELKNDGNPVQGVGTTTVISRHALCLLTLRCMLTVYNFLHASEKATVY
ncbi:hypothetical protein GUJ93_ZPchr0012g20722 [Zizania palustris]|uniref:AT3G52170-like helix-turn-helix domain-containing protein n=1 Tax=Zizania palustris TaxID=103762 RepID=A0A8J5WKZ6_ZIZPA|nr:hypothetical protein GUJ93_ZPchr0012g20722 [Zizania palustris]KAG8093180.1 hypothetical protein GUJ93_ZPchr0012g20722 [Zizania palustris]